MSFDFFPNEQSATMLAASRKPSLSPDASMWENFLPGAGSYAMRSLAEVGRAVDMAGSVFPIVADKITGGTQQQDQYFQEHDDVFNSAVDHWTPRPGEVGTAGQVAGQLVGGLAQAVISPALLVGTSQLSSAEDLVRQGVDAGAANVVGDISGIGAAVGLKLPFLGKTLASRVASGAGGNVAQGAVSAAASHAVLEASGNPLQADQYNALDIKARTLDALLGAAFGGLAHIAMRPSDQAALLVLNQARHMESTTLPGLPVGDVDLTAHVDAMRRAIDQTLRGEPVNVDSVLQDARFVPDAAIARDRAEAVDEIGRLTKEQQRADGPPIEQPEATPETQGKPRAAPAVPEPFPGDADSALAERAAADPAFAERLAARKQRWIASEQQRIEGEQARSEGNARLNEALDGLRQRTPESDPITLKARRITAENPDLQIPSGEFAADGTPVMRGAADVMADADRELASAKATVPDLFKAAANCLLGVL
jgi:hypothetical protein